MIPVWYRHRNCISHHGGCRPDDPNHCYRTSPQFVCVIFVAQILVLPGLCSQQPAPQADEFVRAHYTKYEYRIPMRDGVGLFTAVYVPKAAAFPGDPGPYPFLMERTPYSV